MVDGDVWTLVASIYKDSLERKCDRNDKWTDFVDPTTSTSSLHDLKTWGWGSEEIFGDVTKAVTQDYKSKAYHSLNVKFFITNNETIQYSMYYF